ncbi:arylsulfatase [Agrobacterium rhizogenes]|uniref:arylsulfatase n=1 Tax=Rhizobium rhizogenes TaxID=359 RepID=UPI0022B68AC2|nr:arylsulfatase [Rhizobium rhizogenes]MCZ7447265.1 arylsulfatase [Rhizobium rhizogenes]
MTTRIALIHATPIAVEPIKRAFAAGWPSVELVNLLDDSLSVDRARHTVLTDDLYGRVASLAKYASGTGSRAILFTCSAFGAAIERAATEVPVPVLKPNEAMFEKAIELGARVAMLYTFEPSLSGMEEEFREVAVRMKSKSKLESFFVQGAIEAVRSGDIEVHNRLVAAAASTLTSFDAIVLAHFSTAQAMEAVKAVTCIPVLSSPDAAVEKLKTLLSADANPSELEN